MGCLMGLVLFPVAVLVGSLLAVQASANQQLNKAVGTPYAASTVQLSLAAAVLATLAAATGAIGALGAVPDVRPLLLLGGLASPLYITAGILLFPRLGALTSVGLFVTGQVLASVALDTLGFLAVPARPLTPGVVLGALAVLAGIAVVVRGQQRQARQPVPSMPPASGVALPEAAARSSIGPGWILLGLSAGGGLPVQGAVNAQLHGQVGEPLAVGTISFAVATVAILAVLVSMLALDRTPAPRVRPLRAMPWWGWLGGFCAAAYVTATFLLIPTIGAAVTVALTVTGQQVASAVIDQFGWFGMTRRPMTNPRAVGLGLLLAGSILVQLA